VISALLLYIYSAYLKKIPLAGNVVVSALAAFVFLLLMLFEVTLLNTISFEGAGYALSILLLQVKFYGGFVFLTNFAREIVKDLADKERDDAHNINTFVVEYGDTAAKVLASLILVVLLAGLGFFMYNFLQAKAYSEFVYLAVMVVVPVLAAIGLLWRAKEKSNYDRINLLLKMVMLTGMLSIGAFYLFNK
jgi:4-hydroxybenzoate polyprenyltransferase